MKDVKEILSGKKTGIVKKCFNLAIEAYPPQTADILKREGDRFLNPVGFTIRTEIENIFEEVIGSMDTRRLIGCLENVIKIGAIQNFPPSEAVSFVYLLKRSIRDELLDIKPTRVGDGGWEAEKDRIEQLSEMESRLDRVALLAFDVYMKCREKIHEIKLKETKSPHGRR